MAYHRQQGVDTRDRAHLQHVRAAHARRTTAARSRPSCARRSRTSRSRSSATAARRARFCYVDDLDRGHRRAGRVGRARAREHRQPGRVHAARAGRDGRRADRLDDREIVFEPLPMNDPKQRKPDITRAREVLGWEPRPSSRRPAAAAPALHPREPRRPDGGRVRLRVAAVALVAAVGGALAGPAAPPREVGLMDPAYAAQDPAAYWQDVAALRPASLRYEVHWNEIAPTKPAVQRNPADPAYRWGYLDDVVREAAANGYTGCDLIATVWRTPRWASAVEGPVQLRQHAGRDEVPQLHGGPRDALLGLLRPRRRRRPAGHAAADRLLGDLERAELQRRPAPAAQERRAARGVRLREDAQRGVRRDQGRRQALQLQEPVSSAAPSTASSAPRASGRSASWA